MQIQYPYQFEELETYIYDEADYEVPLDVGAMWYHGQEEDFVEFTSIQVGEDVPEIGPDGCATGLLRYSKGQPYELSDEEEYELKNRFWDLKQEAME